MTTDTPQADISSSLKERLHYLAEKSSGIVDLLVNVLNASDIGYISEKDLGCQYTKKETHNNIKSLRKFLTGKSMKQHILAANNYEEACELLHSGHVSHVLLNWNVGNDEFFSIASDWCDVGVNLREVDNERLIISIRDFPTPPQTESI